MTLRRCEYCGHLWKDRVTTKRKAPDRCPDCHRSLKLTPMSRIRMVIPTSWLNEQIKMVVSELETLPWGLETEGNRNKLQGRLETLKIIERTFIIPEEDLLEGEEMRVLEAEPEGLITEVPVRGKR